MLAVRRRHDSASGRPGECAWRPPQGRRGDWSRLPKWTRGGFIAKNPEWLDFWRRLALWLGSGPPAGAALARMNEIAAACSPTQEIDRRVQLSEQQPPLAESGRQSAASRRVAGTAQARAPLPDQHPIILSDVTGRIASQRVPDGIAAPRETPGPPDRASAHRQSRWSAEPELASRHSGTAVRMRSPVSWPSRASTSTCSRNVVRLGNPCGILEQRRTARCHVCILRWRHAGMRSANDPSTHAATLMASASGHNGRWPRRRRGPVAMPGFDPRRTLGQGGWHG